MDKVAIEKEISKCQKLYGKLIIKLRLIESKLQSLRQKMRSK